MSHGEPRTLVLVADDEEDVRHLVEYRLRRIGYDVVLAADGAEALDLAHSRHPDLAILDVMMPHGSGIEVTRALRAAEDTRDLPVIILTAKALDADTAEGFEAGADDYIKKPFSVTELTARVQAVLGRR